MFFKYTISKNHYNAYSYKETDKVSALLKDLATKCVSPVTEYSDKEIVSALDGSSYMSKNHRSNATLLTRGNLGMIDFEGKNEKLRELLGKLDDKNLFYVAIPSQSNKSDKRNARYHIMYLLSKPYSINSQAMRVQAQEFFTHIGYKWDTPDSGIDPRATFNGCGYFSPTIPIKDAKSKGNSKITDPYIDIDDIAKDTIKSLGNNTYDPIEPESEDANESYNNNFVNGKRVEEITTKIMRTTRKGYILSKDTHIMTNSVDKFVTFEALVEKLAEVEGENPRISGLGCPICNPEHTELKPGYAYMQYDSNDNPYICCTGNGCTDRPYFTMAKGDILVYRVEDSAGTTKYVMIEDGRLLYTNKRDNSYKRSPESVADELYNRGQALLDDNNRYSRGLTIAEYCHGADSIVITNNPFEPEGMIDGAMEYNVSPSARFEPTESEPNDVVKEAIKAFQDDVMINGYPISLIYLSYYLFHHRQIMAVLFLVNSDRGSGKSFWILDLPTWYLGHSKVSGMGSAAIMARWDDEKLGSKLVVYEDVEQLTRNELGVLRAEIKSDATNGSSKMLNIKGQGKTRSFGFNSAGTTNHYDQIPFDGSGDRRIYPAPYKRIDKSAWLVNRFMSDTKEGVKNRTNVVNYLYNIYRSCESNMTKELNSALYYKVPISKIKIKVEDSTSTDGVVAMKIIRRSRNMRSATRDLAHVIASEVDTEDLKDILKDISFEKDRVKIHGETLQELWKVLPTGRESAKQYNYRQYLKIFGIEEDLQHSIRINGTVKTGVILYKAL